MAIKQVVLSDPLNDLHITWSSLLLKKACRESLDWLAEHMPDLDAKKFTREQFIIWLMNMNRDSDANWVSEKYNDHNIEVYADSVTADKIYILETQTPSRIKIMSGMINDSAGAALFAKYFMLHKIIVPIGHGASQAYQAYAWLSIEHSDILLDGAYYDNIWGAIKSILKTYSQTKIFQCDSLLDVIQILKVAKI